MIHLGSDIVDLKKSKDIINNNRFLEKCFSRQEMDLLDGLSINDPWVLWSVKEASYKSHLKLQGHTFNSPRHINILKVMESELEVESEVMINDIRYYSRSKITYDFVYTYSVSKMPSSSIFHETTKVRNNESEEAWEALEVNILQMVNGASIRKNTLGIPVVSSPCKTSMEASISHCGRFYGISYFIA